MNRRFALRMLTMLGLVPLAACANQGEVDDEWSPTCPECFSTDAEPVGGEDATILWTCEKGHAFGKPRKPKEWM